MGNKNFKEMLNYINKYDAPEIKTVKLGANPTYSGPRAGNTQIEEVVEMQNVIKALGATTRRGTIKDPRHVRSTEGFEDWLAEQKMESAKIHGEEWTHEEARTKVEEKQPTKILQFKNIMNSLGRVGSTDREIDSDGRWGPRTQNAIKNVYAFAQALLSIIDSFKKKQSKFTEADLNSLESIIPKETDPRNLSLSELKQKASSATPLIKKVIDLYLFYDNDIVNSPTLNKIFRGEQSLFTVKTRVPVQKTDLQKTYEQGLDKIFIDAVDFNINVSGFSRTKTVEKVPISILQNKLSFQKFLVDSGVFTVQQSTNPVLLKAALQNVVDALEMQKKSLEKKRVMERKTVEKEFARRQREQLTPSPASLGPSLIGSPESSPTTKKV